MMLTFRHHDLMEWIHHLYLEHPEVRTDPAASALYFIYLFTIPARLLIYIINISRQRCSLL